MMGLTLVITVQKLLNSILPGQLILVIALYYVIILVHFFVRDIAKFQAFFINCNYWFVFLSLL